MDFGALSALSPSWAGVAPSLLARQQSMLAIAWISEEGSEHRHGVCRNSHSYSTTLSTSLKSLAPDSLFRTRSKCGGSLA